MCYNLRNKQKFMEEEMNNKGVGAILILTSAILLCTKYLAAAIFMSNINTWSENLFSSSLEYVGSSLSNSSAISLILGIIFLALGIFIDVKEIAKKEFLKIIRIKIV